MNSEYFVYCIAIFSLILYIYINTYSPKLTYVRSNIDNKLYLVQNKDDKVEAANLFAEIRRRLTIIMDNFKQKFGNNDERVNTLLSRFDPEAIREAVPKYNQTSFSINKGEKIVICIRSRDYDEKLSDINTIMFVVLHEIAHLMTISIGHKEEFWENFRFILAHAIKWNVYKDEDYKNNPKPYCGIKITESPLETKDIPKYIETKETRESFKQSKS